MMIEIRAHAIKAKGGTAEPFSYQRALGRHDVLVRITHCSVARDAARMLEFSAEHGIEAIVDVMPSDRVNDAIERVREGDVRMGLVLESRSS